jgi:hypothetical protein
MRTTDGMEIRGTKDNIHMVECTRWKELQGSVEYHAELAGLIEATTIFRLLNDPGAMVGPQEFSICDNTMNGMSKTGEQDIVNAIRIIRDAEPNGVTPLTQHLQAIIHRIQQIEPQLRNQGQKVVVVIATDGLPSDDTDVTNDYVQKEFVDALKRLQRLPVWVVIRLCTNDDSVTDYYNDLDKVLELPLECIDDYFGEAKEIMKVNKWLNYALPLHRCREMGYQHRLFDLLDERRLNRDELVEFLKLLFGPAPFRNAPDINSDWKGFYRVLDNVVRAESKEWDPATRQRKPWIDMKELSKVYGDKRKGCFGFGRRRY